MRADLDQIELHMLAEPEMIGLLRQARADALERLRAAEAEARPSKQELWAEWTLLRAIPKSQLSERQRRFVLKHYAPEFYQRPFPIRKIRLMVDSSCPNSCSQRA